MTRESPILHWSKGVPMTEKELQSQVIDLAHAHGWGVIRLNSLSRGWVRSYQWWDALGTMRSTGVSDLIICRGGIALFFEVKKSARAKSNKGTEDNQSVFRAWCLLHGMKCYRIDSVEVAQEALRINNQEVGR